MSEHPPAESWPAESLVAVHIPANLADRLGGPGAALDRRATEATAIMAHQAGDLTAYELRLILGIETRYELDGYLKARGIYDPMTLEDLQRDLAALDAGGTRPAGAGEDLAAAIRAFRRGGGET